MLTARLSRRISGRGRKITTGMRGVGRSSFSRRFMRQPNGGGNLAGGFSVNSRYRALDAIPFAKSLRFDMELWHWAKTRMNYAPATFWYADAKATWNVGAMPEEARQKVAMAIEDVVEIKRVPGAVEGESMEVIEKTAGRPRFNL